MYGIDPKSVEVWNDYKAWYKDGENRLQIEALKSVTNVTWLSDVDIEVSLEGLAVKYFVTPLQPVEECVRGDEVQVGDIGILAGQYLIIAEMLDDVEDDETSECLSMTNNLSVTSMEKQNGTRRRANRAKQPDSKALCVFR